MRDSISRVPEGAIRYNTDSSKMEVWIGDKWMQVAVSSPTLDGGSRGLFALHTQTIDFLTIPTAGNSQDFGDLSSGRNNAASLASRTRAVFGSGYVPSPAASTNIIDYVTIAQTGNAQDFGDLSYLNYVPAAFSNQTRGIFAGGFNFPAGGNQNNISLITIASTGDATDFGDLITAANSPDGTSSPTRGLIAGGQTPTRLNRIEYITIASTGDAQDFGDLTQVKAGVGALSSATRAVFCGGYAGPSASSVYKTIEKVEIATKGNAVDYGDCTTIRRFCGGMSDCVRGVVAAGHNPSATNNIDYFSISTGGDAVDFGDQTTAAQTHGTSNGHGGL